MELIGQTVRLRVLHDVAELGSFSAAAVRLGVSQSAVSQHVAALEGAIGTRLVERGTRPVQLTEAGAALVRHTRAVLARLDVAEQELGEILGRRAGRLRVGSFPTALATFVPAALRRFRQRHPDVTLTVVDDHAPRLLSRLRDGEFDLAIVFDDAGAQVADDTVAAEALFVDAYRVLLPTGHRLARSGGPVALTQLRGERWVGGTATSTWFRIVRDAARRAGLDPPVSLVSDEYTAVQGFVAAGLGVAVVPGLAATRLPRGVASAPVRGVAPSRKLWVVRPADVVPSAATTAMTELLVAAGARFRN